MCTIAIILLHIIPHEAKKLSHRTFSVLSAGCAENLSCLLHLAILILEVAMPPIS